MARFLFGLLGNSLLVLPKPVHYRLEGVRLKSAVSRKGII